MSYATVDEPHIQMQFYWTDEVDIAEHDPIFKGKAEDGVLSDGIEQWGEPRVVRLPDLNKLGFEVKLDRDGDLVYEVY